MKVTLTVPAELEELIEDALQSGDYKSVEDIALDGLWLWADAVESGADGDPTDAFDQDDLLAQMEAKAKGKS
jgi:Arc/MetJ-type ribon-helix-helix transcriptional regulator